MNISKFLSIIFMFFYFTGNAQFMKGSFMFGGSIAGSYSTSKSTAVIYPPTIQSIIGYQQASIFSTDKTITTINVSPQVGYFIANNFSIGLAVGWNNSKTEEKYLSYNSSSWQSTFFAGPSIRYYLKKNFIQGDFGWGQTNVETKLSYSITSTTPNPDPNLPPSTTVFGSSQESKKNANLLLGSISIGRAFFLDKHAAIEPVVGYQFTKISNSGVPDEKVSTFYLAIGLQYYLSK
jgi:Autotransporter beta-domain